MSRNRRAKRILAEAVPHVGSEVVVIAPGPTGDGYLATSLSLGSAREIAAAITLTNEALKKLRRWHRERLKLEAA